MRLTPPTIPIFLISFLLAGVAIVDLFTHVPSLHGFVAAHRFWILASAYIVLALGVIFPGL
jgi:hypothetical protein